MGRLYRCLLGLSSKEATFARRGFHQGDDATRQWLERIGYTFLQGYHVALEEHETDTLATRLNQVEPKLCGFAFEGAAMALTLLDHLTPWRRNRLGEFLNGLAVNHIYMVHVGIGWALARLPWPMERHLTLFDPLLRWLILDGYGFHQGYFAWRRYIAKQIHPKQLSPYAQRVFDQGLGRSLWFVAGADVARISKLIAAFPPARRADLWSGVGLACAYAGGVDGDSIRVLHVAAEPHQACLAQGAAFAAKARQRAGNPAPHTLLACEILCGLSADAAANVTDLALRDLPAAGPEPAYEVWRQRIQAHFTYEEIPQ